MTKRSLFIFAIVNTLIVALIASYLTTKWHNSHGHAHASGAKESDFHSWMHAQLNLTSEQESSLHVAEEKFEKRSVEIRKDIEQASENLAQAVKSGDSDDPEIESALNEISSHQSELKKLMIDHFFEMKKHLDPEQAEKVRLWVHKSLTSHPHSSSAQ